MCPNYLAVYLSGRQVIVRGDRETMTKTMTPPPHPTRIIMLNTAAAKQSRAAATATFSLPNMEHVLSNRAGKAAAGV